jgi:hypothetical protein
MIDTSLKEAGDLPRHQIIASLTAQHTDSVADTAASLWEKLATEVISIVGDGGFDALYTRSLFLTQSTFPWIAVGSLPLQTDTRFAALAMSLSDQTPAQAGAANRLLLITFTDIMASLIGEALTTGILRSAWSNVAADKNGKELKQ